MLQEKNEVSHSMLGNEVANEKLVKLINDYFKITKCSALYCNHTSFLSFDFRINFTCDHTHIAIK